MYVWYAKVVSDVDPRTLQSGSDFPMRKACAEACKKLTGQEPAAIFSGWGHELTESELAVHENREPDLDKQIAEARERLVFLEVVKSGRTGNEELMIATVAAQGDE